jgi:hypothetical protein
MSKQATQDAAEARADVATVRIDASEFQEELKALITPFETELTGIREQLAALEQRGEDPASTKVQDLEERLVELEEEKRLDQARQTIDSGTPDRSELFRGMFVTDLPAARQAIRQLFDPSHTRAIDSGLFATGGKLNPEQADAFIDFVIEKQTALSRVTTRRMNSPQGHTDELTVSGRKLRKATEGTAPTVSNAIGNKRRTLTTVEVIWAEDITLTFLEDNIERRGAEEHIARLLATQFGNDLNDLGWNGDEGSADLFLQVNDGWLDIATADTDTNASDATGAGTVKEILKAARKTLPVEFKARTDLGYFVPVGTAEEYANEVADRQSAFGDDVLIGGFPVLRYFGTPVIAETHLQGSSAVLTPLSNLHFGIQRALMVDSEWQPRKRAVEYTLSARLDFEYATGKAIVRITNIPAALR